ncbi:Cyanobacterial aminoacyl-tRNA synthetase [Macleaya cordata]|uniref:Cyanobacterial aminoacyl-tRNA synthetase n=1 Tax=Macleaya cordata TaxID=56857 RepID=A0A200PNK0_MACCD|nr:Cyanobacterial aminoacyl-tRNA synthetase [Macleaya cordata]
MELCTSRAISNLPHRTVFYTKPSHLHSRTSLPLKKITAFRTTPGLRYLSTSLLRSKNSEETSTSTNEQIEVLDGKVTMEETPNDVRNAPYAEISNEEVPKEETPLVEQMLSFDFLDRLNLKLDSEDTYSVLIYGSSALITLWLASALVGAIDSIPVFPKVLEIVGLAYTVWFSSRYLIFKRNRDELLTKIEELKQQILGSTDD